MKPIKPSWWTDERVTELKTRWANNETYGEITNAMHAVSRNAVIGKAHRLKLFRITVKRVKTTKPRMRRSRSNGHTSFYRDTGDMVEAPAKFTQPQPFIELSDGDCHWPGDMAPGPDMLCCAAAVIHGKPYCLAHCRLAYARPIARPRL